jgi:hypothetical protein
MPHSKAKILLGVDSGSSGTSPFIFIGDCRLLSLSRQTSTGSASNLTVSLSNDPGFSASPVAWSTITVLPNAGIFAIDPGARWIRVERANIGINATGSTASNETVILNRYYE